MQEINFLEVGKREKKKRAVTIHLTAKLVDVLQFNDLSVAKFMDKLLCNYMQEYSHKFRQPPPPRDYSVDPFGEDADMYVED